jgi:hypothetical protein
LVSGLQAVKPAAQTKTTRPVAKAQCSFTHIHLITIAGQDSVPQAPAPRPDKIISKTWDRLADHGMPGMAGDNRPSREPTQRPNLHGARDSGTSARDCAPPRNPRTFAAPRSTGSKTAGTCWGPGIRGQGIPQASPLPAHPACARLRLRLGWGRSAAEIGPWHSPYGFPRMGSCANAPPPKCGTRHCGLRKRRASAACYSKSSVISIAGLCSPQGSGVQGAQQGAASGPPPISSSGVE